MKTKIFVVFISMVIFILTMVVPKIEARNIPPIYFGTITNVDPDGTWTCTCPTVFYNCECVY